MCIIDHYPQGNQSTKIYREDYGTEATGGGGSYNTAE